MRVLQRQHPVRGRRDAGGSADAARLRAAPAALHQRTDIGGEQGMSGIRLEDVTKRYPNGVKAVDDVSLDIADGEFMVLVGPSGCGKTTLLRSIAGLEDVTAGSIWIGDTDVTEKTPQQRDIAMVFQNYALYPHMSVADN